MVNPGRKHLHQLGACTGINSILDIDSLQDLKGIDGVYNDIRSLFIITQKIYGFLEPARNDSSPTHEFELPADKFRRVLLDYLQWVEACTRAQRWVTFSQDPSNPNTPILAMDIHYTTEAFTAMEINTSRSKISQLNEDFLSTSRRMKRIVQLLAFFSTEMCQERAYFTAAYSSDFKKELPFMKQQENGNETFDNTDHEKRQPPGTPLCLNPCYTKSNGVASSKPCPAPKKNIDSLLSTHFGIKITKRLAETKGKKNGLHIAAMNGDMGSCRRWIKRHQPLDLLDSRGRTALCIAAQQGHETVVRELLAQDVMVNGHPGGSASPLFLALQNGYINIAKLLLAHKDITVNNPSPDFNGAATFPIDIARKLGDDVLTHLLEQKHRTLDDAYGAAQAVCPEPF